MSIRNEESIDFSPGTGNNYEYVRQVSLNFSVDDSTENSLRQLNSVIPKHNWNGDHFKVAYDSLNESTSESPNPEDRGNNIRFKKSS